MSGDRFTEHSRLLSVDPGMRARLLASPKAALAEYFDSIVDGDYRIEVIEQRADTITAMIPAPPGPADDPDGRLGEVSGRVYDLLHTSRGRRLSGARRGAHLGAARHARALGDGRRGCPREQAGRRRVGGAMNGLAGDGPLLIEIPQQRRAGD